MKNKKVVFACFTIPNIFTSYLLSQIVYKDDYKILMLSDWNCKTVYERLKKNHCDLWDEVILISEAGIKEKSERINHIQSQLSQIDFTTVSTLHYYQMNQNSYLNMLFQYLPEDTKVIVTVYTAATYYIKEYIKFAKDYYSARNEQINFDVNRISEIWVYDKRLYVGDLAGTTLRQIPVKEIADHKKLADKFCEELNSIFDYNNQPVDYDVIFLDQYIKRFFRNETEEKELFKKVLAELKPYSVLVKLHPSVNTSLDKYDGLNTVVLKENKVPWEVILLNGIRNKELHHKIFASYYSETLFTTHIFLNQLNIPHKVLHLKEILNQYKTVSRYIGEDMFNRFVERFKKVYAEDFHDIKSFNELSKVLSR